LNSEEQQRREEEPREAEEVSEPVEVGEDPDVVVPEKAVGGEPSEDLRAEPSPEGALPEERTLSEEPMEATKKDQEEETTSYREEISALLDELELARKERNEYLEDMLRMKAELENSRKRQEKERSRFTQLASERLVRELLPVLDNLERALEAEGDIREGVRATRDQLISVLSQEGLAPIFSDGESFDPAFHEAVMSQPSEEHEEDTVVQTLERGYVLNGKAIRPAKVIVAK
jgi:molecular chaperone GrpE